MIKSTKKILTLLVFTVIIQLLIVSYTQGQVNNKRVNLIEQEQVPSNAIDFIGSCFSDAKVKWYSEESERGKTIEGRFRSKASYIALFDIQGNLLHLAATIKFTDIIKPASDSTLSVLNRSFSKYRLVKIEKILTGGQAEVCESNRTKKTYSTVVTNYKIIVKERKEKASTNYELLFDEKGNLLRLEEIRLKREV